MVPVKGHQAYENWLGKRVLTLEDILPAEPLVVCVGINPSPTSVAIGHYYQGPLGQRFFSRLRQAELIDEAGTGFEDDAALLRGVGFTDIVKRPTARADEVTPAEMAAGARLLEERLEPSKPRVIIFTFKKTAEVLFGRFPGAGFKDSFSLAGARCYVMPSPFAPADEVDTRLIELRDGVRNSQSA